MAATMQQHLGGGGGAFNQQGMLVRGTNPQGAPGGGAYQPWAQQGQADVHQMRPTSQQQQMWPQQMMMQPGMQPVMQPAMQTGMGGGIPAGSQSRYVDTGAGYGGGGMDVSGVVPPQLDRRRGPIKSPWGQWPCTRQDVHQAEVPIGLLFSPFSDEQEIQRVSYEPIRSRGGAILAPACQVDFRGKFWVDPFNLQRTPFTSSYAQQLSDTNLPAELLHPAIEYKLNVPNSTSPTFIFVLDTTLYEEELDALKDRLQQILSLMPQDAIVGLITYGTVVNVHELGFTECVKSHVFRGNNEVTKDELQQHLKLGGSTRTAGGGLGGGHGGGHGGGLGGHGGGHGGGLGGGHGGGITGQQRNQQQPQDWQQFQQQRQQTSNHSKFLCTLADCEFILNIILDDLQPDGWPVATDHRAARCTGAALSAAVSLMELCCNQQPGRILLFSGGVCTSGPGQIVGTPLAESIRQHIDLQKNTANAKYVKKATQYYTDLASRAVIAGHSIDIFACALDQTGLYEMKVCAERTGGIVVMSDTFSMEMFRDSLKKLFETGPDGYLESAFNVRIELLVGKDVRICGAIGCVTSSNKKSSQVASEMCVGQGNTCEWVCGVMDKNSTVAFYLDQTNVTDKALAARTAPVQFQVTYTAPNGERKCRVITTTFNFAPPIGSNGPAPLGSGFDQETATVLMGRLAVSKTETEEPVEILRWLDRKLIRLVSLFADYRKDKPDSFQLGTEFLYYPAFMYHLRRSHFLQTFNASPDETAYYRVCLLRENLSNSITMISPRLTQYDLKTVTPIPVDLDSQALKPDVVLLLDSFFHLVIWHGDDIVRWKEAGYHEDPQYANLKAILLAPQADAKRTLHTRLPCPKFVTCNAGGSQSRFLLAKVNPSSTHSSLIQNYGEGIDGTSIITDDVSLSVFMDHLIKLATSA